MTLPWSPAGWWLVAGAFLVTAAIVFVWRRHGTAPSSACWACWPGRCCGASAVLELSAGDLTEAGSTGAT